MRSKLKLALILLVVLVLTTACGKNTEDETPTNETLMQEELSAEPSAIPFAEKQLRVNKYIPFSFLEEAISDPYNKILSDTYGDKLYILERDTFRNTPETNYVLHYFDMDNQTVEQKEFRLPLPEDLDYTIQAMDVTGENELSFKIYGFDLIEGEKSTLYLCKTDSDGTLLEEITPFPLTKKYFFNSPINAEKIWQIPTGDTLIAEQDDTNACANIYTYDAEKDQRTLLDAFDNEYIFALCTDNNENIYFYSYDYIISYNLTTKTTERICQLSGNGILCNGRTHLLYGGSENMFAFVCIGGDRPGIFLLTDEETNAAATIKMTLLTPYMNQYVSQHAGFFGYDYGCFINVEQEMNEQYADSFHDRIMMEIIQGGGPELMWVTERDMRILGEKGALMDISDFIPENVKEQLLPGAVQAGTVNDKLVGLAPHVSFETMCVADSVWPEDNWTVSEMLDVITSRKDWEMLVGYDGSSINSYSLLWLVFCKDLEHSDYLDIDQGISYFDQEEFIRTLAFCEDYIHVGKYAEQGKDEHAKMLREGNAVATVNTFFNGMQDFSSTMCRYGESCHTVGFPVNEGYGNYVYSDGYLVVNANATHIEEIKAYIQYLLDYDNQFTISITPIRMDVIRDRVVKDELTDKYVISLSTKTPIYTELDTKQDGSTYLEEFMSFAESCVPRPYVPEELQTIVTDEITNSLSKTSNHEEVADVIHRRVQLYLDENN